MRGAWRSGWVPINSLLLLVSIVAFATGLLRLVSFRRSEVFLSPPAFAESDLAARDVREMLRHHNREGCSRSVSLEGYQARHGAQAGSVLFRYVVMARAALCGNSTTPPRFLLEKTVTGLGNRLQVAVSALALALASGRVLLVSWPASDECGGCSVEQLFDSPDYPLFVNGQMVFRLSQPHVAHTVSSPARTGFALEWVHCSNLEQALGDWPVVVLHHAHGHRHFAPLVLHNAHHSSFFAESFPGHSFVRQGLRFLFRPARVVQSHAAELRRTVTAGGGRCDVGMHVRTQYMPEEYSEAARVFALAYNSAAESVVAGTEERVSVFVATDTPDVAPLVAAALPPRAQVRWTRETVVRQHAQLCGDVQRALAELFMLSECRVLLGTRESSFSTAAAAMMDPRTGVFVSVCFSPSRCDGATFKRRSPAHGMCYWEWVHSRMFQCRSDMWHELEQECCDDGLCKQCWYHRSGWLSWSSELPYWKPGDAVAVCLVGAAVGRLLLRLRLCTIAVFCGGWGVLLALSVNYISFGNMLKWHS